MARLYDPTAGSVFLDGRDIRSFLRPSAREDRLHSAGAVPLHRHGSRQHRVRQRRLRELLDRATRRRLEKANLSSLLSRFSEGLETKVASSGNSISLGQKQLIAFMRAALRSPELLILDEATANIDTVTEQLLEEILAKLPPQTTKVIIAHRLNTIDNVDQIFFVNSGAIALAGSMEHALDMLLHEKRAS